MKWNFMLNKEVYYIATNIYKMTEDTYIKDTGYKIAKGLPFVS